MCGIAGFFDPRRQIDSPEIAIERMGMSLVHRGPDAGDEYFDERSSVALAHRRLAILDLSEAGAQPMASAGGRYVIVYNGEVYNFKELRAQLVPRGYTFRGNSDTEVVLAAIQEWGVEEGVSKFVGMFAFALWDREEEALFLVRDRVGIKPLYYTIENGIAAFASELKALRAVPEINFTINRGSLASYLRNNYVPDPQSIYNGVFKVEPGHILRIKKSSHGQIVAHPIRYWDLSDQISNHKPLSFANDEQAINQLHDVLSQSVKDRFVSDVPLGAFLSGGIDSSLIVSLMQQISDRPVKTFSIGFDDPQFNEAQHAKSIARHLGTDHTELYVTGQDAIDVIPRLPSLFDEPFSDSSQIPTYLVCQMARRNVTVSLSGDGGDELFLGYRRYQLANQLQQMFRFTPSIARRAMANGLRVVPSSFWDKYGHWLGKISRRWAPRRTVAHSVATLAEFLSLRDDIELYQRVTSHCTTPNSIVLGGTEPACYPDLSELTRRLSYQEQIAFLDMHTYLPSDILTKVDRTSMGVGLEARVPLLDHRVVEFAFRLPYRYKVQGGQGKWILRRLLDRFVPREIMDRPKMGFGVPLKSWLRSELRDWAEALLGESRIRQEGYFDATPIRKMWDEHLSGTRDWHYHLWDVLMFQSWLEANAEIATAPQAHLGKTAA